MYMCVSACFLRQAILCLGKWYHSTYAWRGTDGFVAVQSLSCVWLCNPMDCSNQASPSFTISWSFLRLISIESFLPSNHLILCLPLLLLPSIFPIIRVFSSEWALCIRWPNYWSSALVFPINIQDWFHLRLTGLISLLSKELSRVFYNHNLKASILYHSAFFMVQLSHLYMTTGKIITLTIQTFVSKVISLHFSTVYRWFVIAIFPKVQVPFNFMVAVTINSDYRDQENKVCHCFHFFLFYLPWNNGSRCHDLHFLNVEF